MLTLLRVFAHRLATDMRNTGEPTAAWAFCVNGVSAGNETRAGVRTGRTLISLKFWKRVVREGLLGENPTCTARPPLS
jgi:hypothetical protein